MTEETLVRALDNLREAKLVLDVVDEHGDDPFADDALDAFSQARSVVEEVLTDYVREKADFYLHAKITVVCLDEGDR